MESGGPTLTDNGSVDDQASAATPPLHRSKSSLSRTPEENGFLQCVDVTLAADKRLSYVTSKSSRWKVERTISCGDGNEQSAPSFRLYVRSANDKKWIAYPKGVLGQQDVQDHARTLLQRSRGGGKALKGDDKDEDEDEDADADATDQLVANGAKEYANAKPSNDLHDEDDEDGDVEDFKRDVIQANRDRKLELPEDFAPREFKWQEKAGMRPGKSGFSAYVREQMESNYVPSTKEITAPADTPVLQPYQQTASFIAHPSACAAFASPESQQRVAQGYPRLLVAHCTGSGKTCTMIRIADNFFKDRRPKILLFPKPAVCENFYRELMSPKFPNRFANFLIKNNLQGKNIAAMRSALEMGSDKMKGVVRGRGDNERGPSGLLRGTVTDQMLNDEEMPSAPLRAFSYTQAGGKQSCGEKPNAVFACPDGYRGGWKYDASQSNINPAALEALRKAEEDWDLDSSVGTKWGYEDYRKEFDGNPFSNKVILMDEVHNLINPSPDILKNEKRSAMLTNLTYMLKNWAYRDAAGHKGRRR